MSRQIRKPRLYGAGKIVLLAGVLLLLGGLICTITVGTLAVPILLSSSVIVNSVGISLMHYGK